MEKSRITSLLSLHPSKADKVVLSHFWVDNFDLETDKQYGGGAINITTWMAFQEGASQASNLHVRVPRKVSCRISNEEQLPNAKTVDKQIERPTRNMENHPDQFHFDENKILAFYFAWIIARNYSSFDQTIPIFSGFMTNTRKITEQVPRKTVETYLPPINLKVYMYIYMYISYLLSGYRLQDDQSIP